MATTNVWRRESDRCGDKKHLTDRGDMCGNYKAGRLTAQCNTMNEDRSEVQHIQQKRKTKNSTKIAKQKEFKQKSKTRMQQNSQQQQQQQQQLFFLKLNRIQINEQTTECK